MWYLICHFFTSHQLHAEIKYAELPRPRSVTIRYSKWHNLILFDFLSHESDDWSISSEWVGCLDYLDENRTTHVAGWRMDQIFDSTNLKCLHDKPIAKVRELTSPATQFCTRRIMTSTGMKIKRASFEREAHWSTSLRHHRSCLEISHVFRGLVTNNGTDLLLSQNRQEGRFRIPRDAK